MDDKLIELMNKVPDVFAFSGEGHGRLFNRETKARQASKSGIEKGRNRRKIEAIEEERRLKAEYDYL